MHPAAGLLAFVTAVSNIGARPIHTFPSEIRKRNYVRVSEQTCEECMTIGQFFEAHRLGFLLFYERELRSGNKYKAAVVKGWMETCQELRWSRIACGLVDMVDDYKYAESYIEDPRTVPAHVVFRNGQPVMAMKEQVAPLLAKPGDKATMLSHVADLLKVEGPMGNLTLSTQVGHKEGLQRLIRQHELVIVAFVGESRQLSDVFRAAVQEMVLAEGIGNRISTNVPAPDSGRTGKGNALKEKFRIAFVAAQGKGMAANFLKHDSGSKALEPCIATFIGGVAQPGPSVMKVDAKFGDAAVTQAVKKAMGMERRKGKVEL